MALTPMEIAATKKPDALAALVRYRKATESLCGKGITEPGAHQEYDDALLELIKQLPNQ